MLMMKYGGERLMMNNLNLCPPIRLIWGWFIYKSGIIPVTPKKYYYLAAVAWLNDRSDEWGFQTSSN